MRISTAEMAQKIVDTEARRDAHGALMVYRLPGNDGGGSYEVAGINERYHPQVARDLAALIEDGRYKEAERRAVAYVGMYTAIVLEWSTDLYGGIEYFLRDCVFNRGPAGAAKILQLALRVQVDGKVGPVTKAALRDAKATPFALLGRLRQEREGYERQYVGYRANFWNGLENRWDTVTDVAGLSIGMELFIGETPAPAPAPQPAETGMIPVVVMGRPYPIE